MYMKLYLLAIWLKGYILWQTKMCVASRGMRFRSHKLNILLTRPSCPSVCPTVSLRNFEFVLNFAHPPFRFCETIKPNAIER